MNMLSMDMMMMMTMIKIVMLMMTIMMSIAIKHDILALSRVIASLSTLLVILRTYMCLNYIILGLCTALLSALSGLWEYVEL